MFRLPSTVSGKSYMRYNCFSWHVSVLVEAFSFGPFTLIKHFIYVLFSCGINERHFSRDPFIKGVSKDINDLGWDPLLSRERNRTCTNKKPENSRCTREHSWPLETWPLNMSLNVSLPTNYIHATVFWQFLKLWISGVSR